MRSTWTLLLSFLFVLSAAAQKGRTITGIIKSADANQPLDKVVITEKGTKNVALSNVDGRYSLTLQTDDAVLSFSFVGFETQEISVDGKTTIDLNLGTSQVSLSEVVVTALGIKREVRTLGYASQQVTSTQLTQSKQSNLLNALQGKVAGVTISSAGGGPGQGASILIRGVNSLNPDKDNQPLFVVDGMPIDNSTFTTGTTGGRGVQMPNRVSDINPEDIESINILRGGAATALYGLRGANGVVVLQES